MKRILLIDDEEGIRIVWKKWHDVMEPTFRGQCEMDTAKSLKEAKEMMAKNEYDALILDLTMPPDGQDGIMSWIAETTPDPKVAPIIILTGDEDIWVRRRCMLMGAAQFFTKSDAEKFPNLFFKVIYNEYLKRYGATRETIPA